MSAQRNNSQTSSTKMRAKVKPPRLSVLPLFTRTQLRLTAQSRLMCITSSWHQRTPTTVAVNSKLPPCVVATLARMQPMLAPPMASPSRVLRIWKQRCPRLLLIPLRSQTRLLSFLTASSRLVALTATTRARAAMFSAASQTWLATLARRQSMGLLSNRRCSRLTM